LIWPEANIAVEVYSKLRAYLQGFSEMVFVAGGSLPSLPFLRFPFPVSRYDPAFKNGKSETGNAKQLQACTFQGI